MYRNVLNGAKEIEMLVFPVRKRTYKVIVYYLKPT